MGISTLTLVAFVAVGLAAVYAFRPKPAKAPAATPMPLIQYAEPIKPVDAAYTAVQALRQVEDEGLARRLRDGAGLHGLGQLNTVVNLAGQQAGLAPQPQQPAPAPAKSTPAK